MLTANLHSRLPSTALCLCAMLLVSSLSAFAQTPWDAQDQADMLRGLQAQGLVRSPESARAEAAGRGEPSPLTRVHEAGRDDPRRRSGHGRGPGTPPRPDAKAGTDAATPSMQGTPCT
jgi:hypothetical protein